MLVGLLPHPVTMAPPLHLGHLIEGVVEQDPMTDRYVIRTTDSRGRFLVLDVQTLLAGYVGQEVRLTLASFEHLAQLARLVEEQGSGQVFGVQPEQLPEVPFDIVRKG